jgi:hypothetical protein
MHANLAPNKFEMGGNQISRAFRARENLYVGTAAVLCRQALFATERRDKPSLMC